MHLLRQPLSLDASQGASFSPLTHLRTGQMFLLVCFGVMTFGASTHPLLAQNPRNPDQPYIIPEANPLPDKNAQMAMHDQQAKKQSFDAANLERKRQLDDDSARLLKLANDLKAEIDKTSKDTLSLSVIRKADEIERLAHNVKEKMKLTVGAN